MKVFLLILLFISIMGFFIYKHFFSNANDIKRTENTAVNLSSSDLEILPTLNSVSYAKNQVWVGTFQLVWNDLINELLKAPVKFVNYESAAAENLNKQEFTADNLSKESYYKKWGEALPSLKSEIERGIRKKFNETSDILDKLEWDSSPELRKYVLYAMLKKDFEFFAKFNILDTTKFEGSNKYIKYFGFKEGEEYIYRNSFEVLFYNNPKEFAAALKTKHNDKVYLYRNNESKTLDILYKDMISKAAEYNGSKTLTDGDEFRCPIISYKTDKEFSDFYYKEIQGTDLVISKAIETIDFKMNEAGVKLKSEAVISVGKGTAIKPQRASRRFNFDGPFVMFIEEEGKKPYFAMKVEDAAKLQ